MDPSLWQVEWQADELPAPLFNLNAPQLFLFLLPSSPCLMSFPSSVCQVVLLILTPPCPLFTRLAPLKFLHWASYHQSFPPCLFFFFFLFRSIFMFSVSISLLFLLTRSTEGPGKVLWAFCTRWPKFRLCHCIYTDTTPPTRGLCIL